MPNDICIKDIWISLSTQNITKQAVAHSQRFYDFISYGIPEMTELLPVACKQFMLLRK